MKTVSVHYAIVYLITVSLMLSAVIVLVPAAHSIEMEKSARIAQLAASQPVPEPAFVLQAYDGHLALWREGAEKPYCILKAELWLLSDADRAAVESGIRTETEGELHRLLEDLGAEE